MTHAIRKARPSDVEHVFHIVNEAYQVESGEVGCAFKNCNRFISVDEARENFDDLWILPDVKDVPMGLVCAPVKDGIVYVGPLAVAKSAQGQGAGSKLMAFAESLAPKVKISVVSCRSDLFPWYKRRGFQEVGRIPVGDHIPKDRLTRFDLDMVVMQKTKKQ